MSVTPVFSSISSTSRQESPPSVDLYTPRSPPAAQRDPSAATRITSLSRGSMRIFPMCCESRRPTFSHVSPPLRLR